MANRRPRRVGVTTHKRPKGWARINSTAYQVIPANTKVLLGTFILSNPGIGATVLRTRGAFSVASDQGASSEEQLGAWGMIIVNDLALAAGVASIPGPITDASDDGWFLWQSFQRQGLTSGAITSEQYFFDSKAMRKIREGFGVAIVVENGQAAHGLEFAFGIAMLTSIS